MAAVVMKSLFVLYEKPCSGEFHRRAPVEPAAALAQGFRRASRSPQRSAGTG